MEQSKGYLYSILQLYEEGRVLMLLLLLLWHHVLIIIIIIIIIIITELLWRLLQSIVRPTAPYNMRVHKND